MAEGPIPQRAWTGRELPKLSLFEGDVAHGVWTLSAENLHCDTEPCDRLPSYLSATLEVNHPEPDFSQDRSCSELAELPEAPEQSCLLSASVSDALSDEADLDTALISGLSIDQQVRVTAVTSSADQVLYGGLKLYGSERWLTRFTKTSPTTYELTWTPRPDEQGRLTWLSLSAAGASALPISYTLSSSVEDLSTP